MGLGRPLDKAGKDRLIQGWSPFFVVTESLSPSNISRWYLTPVIPALTVPRQQGPVFAYLHLAEYTHNSPTMGAHYDLPIKEMLARLASRGDLNNTFFLLMSDHGYQRGDDGFILTQQVHPVCILSCLMTCVLCLPPLLAPLFRELWRTTCPPCCYFPPPPWPTPSQPWWRHSPTTAGGSPRTSTCTPPSGQAPASCPCSWDWIMQFCPFK